MSTKEKIGLILIVLISISASLSILLLDPIPQDVSYHQFHDTRLISSIPNFWNVVSNLPFLLVGIWGLSWLRTANENNHISQLRFSYIGFFTGIALVGLGSSYYHLSPDNSTLVWDRIPMTLAFMSLFSIIVAEFISVSAAKRLLLPLLLAGLASVLYWHYTELSGRGDLRLYILVQFLPMLLTPIILFFFKPTFTHRRSYWLLILAYFFAKILEHFDKEVMELLPLLSGHTLKHLTAALGIGLLVSAYYPRRRKL